MGLFDIFKNNKENKNTKFEKPVKTYKREFKVADVLSENNDGTPRQKILQAITENKKPFHKKLNVEIKPYSLKGVDGMAVIVNKQIIGNISRKDLYFLENNQDRLLGIRNIYIGENSNVYYANITIEVKEKS